ncbi:MAG TPA: hypothetical protein VK190_10085 [Pseudoneobacillus sp.]|nr:hypothetical protein [Pseudoneobacillus sp.]
MIQTGDSFINWNSFKACSDKKDVILIENGKVALLGSTVEEITIDEEKDLLHRKQKLIFLDPNKANRIVNLEIKLSTFEPITCFDKGPKNVTVRYEAKEIEMEIEAENHSSALVKHELEDGLFDLFSVELLLRLLPLEIGFTNELRVFNHMVNDTITVKLDVVGLENISDGSLDVDAWKVNVFLGENLQTYWIGKDTKELLKQSVKISENVYFEFVR